MIMWIVKYIEENEDAVEDEDDDEDKFKKMINLIY